MNISYQVTSLELSKNLKELGVKQESYFYWQNNGYEFFLEEGKPLSYDQNNQDYVIEEINGEIAYYSAFTVAELLEMIPKRIISKDDYLYVKFYKEWFEEDDNLYICELNEDGDYNSDYIKHSTRDETSANSCAKMIIYLIENGMMKI